MSVFSKSHAKIDDPDKALENARERKIELEAEFAKRFGARAAADALIQGSKIDEKARGALEDQINTCIAEIAGLEALRDEHVVQQKAAKVAEMRAEKDQLQEKRAALASHFDQLRVEEDTTSHELRKVDGQIQMLSRFISNAQAPG